jgi:hypothetical protein
MNIVTCVSIEYFFQQWELQDNVAIHAARCIEFVRMNDLIDAVSEKASLHPTPTDWP